VYIERLKGGTAAERAFFEENLAMEVRAAGYNVFDDVLDAVYSIGGSIAPEEGGKALSLALSNVAESREMVIQELFFVEKEDAYELLPFLVWQMMANAPFLVLEAPPPPPPAESAAASVARAAGRGSAPPPIVNLVNAVPDDEAWKNKRLFLGAKFGPRLQFYRTGPASPTKDADLQNFTLGAGLEASVRVLDLLALQAEVNFGTGNADYRGLPREDTTADHLYRASYLSFPLLAKGVITPGDIFLVEPYGGAYLTLNLALPGEDLRLPPGGWLAGIALGVKAGSGVFSLDFRYATDFWDATVTGEYGGLVELRRRSAAMSAGYKLGFVNRGSTGRRPGAGNKNR
jgi:hypothetical protein